MLMTEFRLDVRPLSGAIGAEVFGVDLAEALDEDTIREIRAALLEHVVIFFRDQELSPSQLLALAERFGEPAEYPLIKGLPECPLVLPIIKEAHERTNFGGIWHSDTAYLERPALGTLLYALETPPAGGDTMFANMYLAYETLSEGMRRLLDGLRGVNVAGKPVTLKTREEMQSKRGTTADPEAISAVHPVVRTHPETGREALYVNVAHTARFDGMTEEESRPLLQFLFQHQVRPEFTCRFRWEVGSVAMWDNRCVQHNPVNDYHGHRRVMHRITLQGDAPR